MSRGTEKIRQMSKICGSYFHHFDGRKLPQETWDGIKRRAKSSFFTSSTPSPSTWHRQIPQTWDSPTKQYTALSVYFADASIVAANAYKLRGVG